MTEIRCYGCGAIIQSADTKKPGYVPESALSKEKILCQRCYKLMHYHQKMESHLTKDDFLHVLQTVGEKDCLVVYIVDLFDFNGSLVPGLMRHIGYNDVLVLANKRDILPKSLKEHRLNTWVRRQFKEYGIKPLDVVITSGKKNMNFDEIFDKIDEYRHGRDVYVVGITNVGKSTFINRMLKNYSDASNLITTSEFPGTTLDLIKIPLDDHSSLYDTPGIMNEHQYTSVVDEKDLITGKDIKAGDTLIGIASSGVHSNGFSLVRSVFKITEEALNTYYDELGKTLGEALLAPTKIYVKALKHIKASGITLKACSHITGGGFYENVPRMLKDGMGVEIDTKAFPKPPIFDLIQKNGDISTKEMYNVFNMGLGFVMAVDPSDVEKVQTALNEINEPSYVVGKVTETGQVDVQW